MVDGLCVVQNDVWAAYPPSKLQWPAAAAADFFINVYDWDVLELSPGYASELSLSLELCTAFFPCRIHVQGRVDSQLIKTINGSISCNVRYGCSGVKVLYSLLNGICFAIQLISI
jgi:hypothetical protein